MDFNKCLKVAVFDPDSNDEFLFGIEFLKDKVILSSCKEDPSQEFKSSLEKFGLSLDFAFHILYVDFMKK